jgi:hypothetical protein
VVDHHHFYWPSTRYRATAFEVSIPGTKYQRQESSAVLTEFIRQVQELHGVEAAGAINVIPLAATSFTWAFEIERRPVPRGTALPRVDYRVVTPGIFPAMQIPLTRGRLLGNGDGTEAPSVAIINDAMAKRFWPNGDPIGQRIRIEGSPRDGSNGRPSSASSATCEVPRSTRRARQPFIGRSLSTLLWTCPSSCARCQARRQSSG